MKTKPVKTLTIRRKRWIRGEGDTRSYLLRPDDNKMCCLGFYCLAAGISSQEISNLSSPRQVGVKLPGLTRKERDDWLNTTTCCELMGINDDLHPELEREAKIKAGFKKIGVSVTFVG